MKDRFKQFKFFMGTLCLSVLGLFTIIQAAGNPGEINLSKTAQRQDDYGRTSTVSLKANANGYTSSQKIDVVLVMDGSGSMAYGPNGQYDYSRPNRLQAAKTSATAFVNSLMNGKYDVEMGIVEYGTNVKDTQNLTNNRQTIDNFIANKYDANGGTNLQSGIAKAKEILEAGSRPDAKTLVVILTDGIPTFYNHNGVVCGDGSENKPGPGNGNNYSNQRMCNNLSITPSQAAKEELDSLKSDFKEADVYTITLGNEAEAAEILKEVNPEQENPSYKNYEALTEDDLNKLFEEILTQTINTIGRGTVVTDTIPNTFTLSADSKTKLEAAGVTVTENSDGTTTLTWNIGDLTANQDYTLTYDVVAKDDYHGSMYTNTSATLNTTVSEDNPAYTDINVDLEFNKPTTEVPTITKDDNYSTYEGEAVSGSILDNDLNKNTFTDKENASDNLTVSDTLIINENESVKKNSDGTYSIYKDGTLQGTLSINNDGKFTFTPEPGVTGNVEFTYSVDTIVTTNGSNDTVHSNTSTVTIEIAPKAKVSVEGTKTWNDNNNQDGIRPNSITINLYADGTRIASKEIAATDNWEYSFDDLNKYQEGHENDNDYEIEYTVKEENVSGYTSEINGYNITNTHEIEKVSVEGTKTWNDNNNQDGIRPDSITVNLYADGTKVDSKEVTEEDNWAYSFDNLDKFKDGKEIVYTVSEDTVDGYTGNVNGYDITNTHSPIKTSITVQKSWVDGNNQDGIRPNSITVNLLANGEKVDSKEITAADNWTYKFDNLDKFKDGKEIVYTFEEVNVADGYEVSYDQNNIVNTHSPSEKTISGKKIWNDSNNNDGIRPSEITVTLSGKVGENEVINKTQTVSEKTNWEYNFENLPEYNNGSLINYTVTENAVEGYSTEIKSTENGFDITNTHSNEQVNISGQKTWNDNDDQDGKRPQSITVNLLADGSIVKTVEVTAENNWKFDFGNLDKYKDGKEIKYTVTEEDVDGYTAEIIDFNITNTHTPETLTYTVTKNWNDNNNNDNIRPDEITVSIKANGNIIQSVKLSEANNWTYTFENLPRYENGKEIKYEIIESEVKGYTSTIESGTIDENNNISSVITNTHKIEKTEITVNKIWNDDNSAERPNSIKVYLKANGIIIKEVIITKEMGWTYTFKDLPKYSAGKLIDYSVMEEEVENYETSYDGFNIINTLTKKYENTEIIPPQTGNVNTNSNILFILLGLLSLGLAYRKVN